MGLLKIIVENMKELKPQFSTVIISQDLRNIGYFVLCQSNWVSQWMVQEIKTPTHAKLETTVDWMIEYA